MNFKEYVLRQRNIIRSHYSVCAEDSAQDGRDGVCAEIAEADAACGFGETIKSESEREERVFDGNDSERLLSELDNLRGLNTRERLSFCA